MNTTKREWEVCQNKKWPFTIIIRPKKPSVMHIAIIEMFEYSTDDKTIDDVKKRNPKNIEKIANAHLIAAAPDLLKALKNLYNQTVMTEYNAHCFRKAIQAIEKAERGKI